MLCDAAVHRYDVRFQRSSTNVRAFVLECRLDVDVIFVAAHCVDCVGSQRVAFRRLEERLQAERFLQRRRDDERGIRCHCVVLFASHN
jgi:hypothetical protein